jgi:hypothetical protein
MVEGNINEGVGDMGAIEHRFLHRILFFFSKGKKSI